MGPLCRGEAGPQGEGRWGPQRHTRPRTVGLKGHKLLSEFLGWSHCFDVNPKTSSQYNSCLKPDTPSEASGFCVS